MPHLSLEPHAAAVLWVELAALLITARALAALARRVGQPSIVGALLAGLLLGPSVFGQLWPAGFDWFLPSGRVQGSLLGTVAQLSLLMLLIVLGAETDLPLIRSLGRASAWVTSVSVAVPFAAGFAAGYLLPDALLGGDDRLPFALLMGGALGVSSLPVVASIIRELGMARRNFGQIAVAAATVHDGLGFLVLAVAGAFAGQTTGASGLLVPFVGLVVLVGVLALVGQPVVDAALRRVRRRGPNVAGSLTVSIACALTLAAVAQGLRLEGALGAFLAGVVLGRSRFQQGQALRYLEAFTAAVFTPLYFATAGLQVQLTALGRPPVLASFFVLLVVAAAAKYAGALLGAVAARMPAQEGRVLGVALNGRGALQVIIASGGLAMGVFGPAAYSAVILLSIIVSMGVPPLLHATVRRWGGSEEERQRLEREEELESNVVVRGQRLLLPSRGNPNSLAAARLLACAWPEGSEVTVFSIVDQPGSPPDIDAIESALPGRAVRRRRVTSPHVLDEILAEANLGYGVIGLGTVESPGHGRLLPPVVEGLLNRSPIPMLIVRRGKRERLEEATRYRRIAVPVSGRAASRAGQEVANNISRRTGGEVTLLHTLTRPSGNGRDRGPTAQHEGHAGSAAHGAAAAILDQAHETATAQDVRPNVVLRHGSSAAEEIETAVREMRADLVVLGATVRRVAGRPFLGHTVEHVLEHATEPTIVVVVLPDVAAAAADAHADRTAR